MGISAAVIAVASVVGTGYSIYEGEKAKDATKEAQKKQEKANTEAEQRTLQGAAKESAAAIKSKQMAEQEQARQTAKVNERQKRQGRGSLLTGSEGGLSGTGGSNLGSSSILV